MTASDKGTEKASDSVSHPPAPAFVPGRRISLDAYGVKKLPKIEGPQTAEVDDFGLPTRRRTSRASSRAKSASSDNAGPRRETSEHRGEQDCGDKQHSDIKDGEDDRGTNRYIAGSDAPPDGGAKSLGGSVQDVEDDRGRAARPRARSRSAQRVAAARSRSLGETARADSRPASRGSLEQRQRSSTFGSETSDNKRRSRADTLGKISESGAATTVGGVSEWSHQALAPRKEEVIEEKEEEWQAMPALDKYDLYDDEGRLLAKGNMDSDDDDMEVGGPGKGYTRVQIDDDAKSATSMDENTGYLFKEKGTNVVDEDEDQRDPLAQMQATKELLTEGQRIAYVGVARLSMVQMLGELEKLPSTKAIKKELGSATENLKMWSQKMMVRLYSHMDIDAAGRPESIVSKAMLTKRRTTND